MNTSTSLIKVLDQLTDALVESIGEAIMELECRIVRNSPKYKELILFKSRLIELKNAIRKGTITYDQRDARRAQLREDMLQFIHQLTEEDLGIAVAPTKAKKKSKRGNILYRIPDQMQLHKETRCVVRLAYDKEILTEDFDVTDDTRIKSIRIAEVMGVEMLDPNEDTAFHIRTFNEPKQFLDEDDYSEWIFRVKPVKEGTFPLLLKVAVIEEVRGKERKREVVLEEMVNIVIEAVEIDTPPKTADYEFSYQTSTSQGYTYTIVQNLRKYAAVIAIFLAGSVTMMAVDVPQEIRWQLVSMQNTEDSYNRYLEKYPDGKYREKALFKKAKVKNTTNEYQGYLNTYPDGQFIDEATWNKADLVNTREGYMAYLAAFPEGKYAEEARRRLAQFDQQDLPTDIEETTLSETEEVSIEETEPTVIETVTSDDKVEELNNIPSVEIDEDFEAWSRAKAVHTASAYEDYLRNFPNGKYRQLAQAAFNELNSARASDPFRNQMIYVQGGSFSMGSNTGNDDERPVHTVKVSSFYMSKYEVTQAQWQAIMGDNPSQLTCMDCPVGNVSWNDIQEFLKKLNAQSGKSYRLPTEAEWEYAAKSGGKSDNIYSGGNDLGEIAFFFGNAKSKAHEVGSKEPNELGIYDMTGNVWEWCSDYYGSAYYSQSPAVNPTGPASGDKRVLRGGSWNDGAALCRNTSRYRVFPTFKKASFGFRVVRN